MGRWDENRPTACGSKTMSPEQQKYGAPKQEMLAVVVLLEKSYAYLAEKEFTLRVDNKALRWLKTCSTD